MTFDLIAIIVNSIFLLVAFILSLLILRSGTLFALNSGDNEVQNHYKWIILTALLALLLIGLTGAGFNIVYYELM